MSGLDILDQYLELNLMSRVEKIKDLDNPIFMLPRNYGEPQKLCNIILVEGVDGVGKTTFVNRMVKLSFSWFKGGNPLEVYKHVLDRDFVFDWITFKSYFNEDSKLYDRNSSRRHTWAVLSELLDYTANDFVVSGIPHEITRDRSVISSVMYTDSVNAPEKDWQMNLCYPYAEALSLFIELFSPMYQEHQLRAKLYTPTDPYPDIRYCTHPIEMVMFLFNEFRKDRPASCGTPEGYDLLNWHYYFLERIINTFGFFKDRYIKFRPVVYYIPLKGDAEINAMNKLNEECDNHVSELIKLRDRRLNAQPNLVVVPPYMYDEYYYDILRVSTEGENMTDEEIRSFMKNKTEEFKALLYKLDSKYAVYMDELAKFGHNVYPIYNLS